MDDSEKSYGYSKDIYHGSQGVGGHYEPGHADESYESAGEGDLSTEGEPSPEEAAMHVVDREEPRPENPVEPVGTAQPEGRSSTNRVESFTWENKPSSVPEK